MSGERLLTCLGVSCWLRFLQLVKGLFIGTLVLSITRRRGHLKDKGRDPRVDAGGGKGESMHLVREEGERKWVKVG